MIAGADADADADADAGDDAGDDAVSVSVSVSPALFKYCLGRCPFPVRRTLVGLDLETLPLLVALDGADDATELVIDMTWFEPNGIETGATYLFLILALPRLFMASGAVGGLTEVVASVESTANTTGALFAFGVTLGVSASNAGAAAP